MIISGLLHPLHPEISMQVLCTIPPIFLRLLWERICPWIKGLLRLQSFSWFSSTYCLIIRAHWSLQKTHSLFHFKVHQWWYCWVKLDAYYSEQSNVIVKEKMTERVDLMAPPTTFEVWYQIMIAWYRDNHYIIVITMNCGVSIGSTNNYVFRNFQQYTQKYPTK